MFCSKEGFCLFALKYIREPPIKGNTNSVPLPNGGGDKPFLVVVGG